MKKKKFELGTPKLYETKYMNSIKRIKWNKKEQRNQIKTEKTLLLLESSEKTWPLKLFNLILTDLTLN